MEFLIIDDNPLLNRFLSTYLQDKGHIAWAITDPSTTINWLKEHPELTAIILDLSFHGNENVGVETLRTIREIYSSKTLPVIIFTGAGFNEPLMKQCRDAGANGYVSKGLGPSEIYSAIMRVVQKPQHFS